MRPNGGRLPLVAMLIILLKKSRGKETYIKVSKYTTLLVRKRFTAFLVSQVFMKGFNSDELVGIQILLLKYIN